MAEYTNVEKPFFDKLQLLGLEVINQGQGIPQEAEKSLRSNFIEVVLPKTFKESIKDINLTQLVQKRRSTQWLQVLRQYWHVIGGLHIFQTKGHLFVFCSLINFSNLTVGLTGFFQEDKFTFAVFNRCAY